MEIVGNILLWCVAIILVIITIVIIIAFIETIYTKLNYKNIQQKKLEELQNDIGDFVNAMQELNKLREPKKTTKKKETK